MASKKRTVYSDADLDEQIGSAGADVARYADMEGRYSNAASSSPEARRSPTAGSMRGDGWPYSKRMPDGSIASAGDAGALYNTETGYLREDARDLAGDVGRIRGGAPAVAPALARPVGDRQERPDFEADYYAAKPAASKPDYESDEWSAGESKRLEAIRAQIQSLRADLQHKPSGGENPAKAKPAQRGGAGRQDPEDAARFEGERVKKEQLAELKAAYERALAAYNAGGKGGAKASDKSPGAR